jgi:hypothetical protein
MTKAQWLYNKTAGLWSDFRKSAVPAGIQSAGSFAHWRPWYVAIASQSAIQDEINGGLTTILSPILGQLLNISESQKSQVLNISQDVDVIGQSFSGISDKIKDLEVLGEYYAKLDSAMADVTVCKSRLTDVFLAIREQDPDVADKDAIIDHCEAILTNDLKSDFSNTQNCSSNSSNRRLPGEAAVAQSYVPDTTSMTEDEKNMFCFEHHANVTDPDGMFTAANCGPGATYETCGQGLTSPPLNSAYINDFRQNLRTAIVLECHLFWSLMKNFEVFDLYKNLLNEASKLNEMISVLNQNVEYVKQATTSCDADLGGIRDAYTTNVENLYFVFQCQRLAAAEYTDIAKITSTTSTTTMSTTTSTPFVFEHALSACPRKLMHVAAAMGTLVVALW